MSQTVEPELSLNQTMTMLQLFEARKKEYDHHMAVFNCCNAAASSLSIKIKATRERLRKSDGIVDRDQIKRKLKRRTLEHEDLVSRIIPLRAGFVEELVPFIS
jgi:hypothetical protein